MGCKYPPRVQGQVGTLRSSDFQVWFLGFYLFLCLFFVGGFWTVGSCLFLRFAFWISTVWRAFFCIFSSATTDKILLASTTLKDHNAALCETKCKRYKVAYMNTLKTTNATLHAHLWVNSRIYELDISIAHGSINFVDLSIDIFATVSIHVFVLHFV